MNLHAANESKAAQAETDLAWLIEWIERAVIRWDYCSEPWSFKLYNDACWIRIVVDTAKLELWKIRDAQDVCLACALGAKALAPLANEIATWRGVCAQQVWSCTDLQALTALGRQW